MSSSTSSKPAAARAGRSSADTWSVAAVAGLKTVAGAVFGAAAALAAAHIFQEKGAALLMVLVGMTIGVLALGPGRPRALEDWLGRGTLVIALMVVGASLGSVSLVGAWLACSAGLAMAAHDTADRANWAEVIFRGAMAAAATGLGFYVMLSQGLEVSAPGVMALASIMGLGGFLAGWMEVDTSRDEVPALPDAQAKAKATAKAKAKKAKAKAKAKKAKKAADVVDAGFSGAGDDVIAAGGDASVFAAETERLAQVASRVEALLERTEQENPEEQVFVEGVRDRVQTMMSQARASVARWRKAGDGFEAARIAAVSAELETHQATLEGMGDPAMRRELELAIERQERMLSMLQSMERARTTFGFRLAQVTSGLELLEVTLKRALTVGEGIDTSEIDALVEVMDAFDDDEEQSSGLARLTEHGLGEDHDTDGTDSGRVE